MEIIQCRCQFCGNSHDFAEARQEGYGSVSVSAFKAQPLYHIICLNCGSVVRSFVRKPEKFYKYKLSESYSRGGAV